MGIRYQKRDFDEWEYESVLRENGYTVDRKIALTGPKRHKILERVIDQNIMTSNQVISFIELQIKLREKQGGYEEAISKWKYDLEHLKRTYPKNSTISRDAEDYVVNTYFLHCNDNKLYALYELKNPNNIAISIEGRGSFLGEGGNEIDYGLDDIVYMSPGTYNFMIFCTDSGPKSVTVSLNICETNAKLAQLHIEEEKGESLRITASNVGQNQADKVRVTVITFENGSVNGFSRGLKRISLNPGEFQINDCDLSYDKYYIYWDGVTE